MVTPTEELDSRPMTPEEIAGAQATATEVLTQGRITTGESVSEAQTIPGQVKPMTYHIPPSDQGSWVLVWELAKDANGEIFGTPTKAPRNQLGLWLEFKKRPDGGPRYTVNQPPRVRAEAQYQCLHQECPKKLYSRLDLVDHVQGTHPREARLYKALLDEIMLKASEDNPRLAEIARTMANMQERGVVSVATGMEQKADPTVDTQLGLPTVSTMGLVQPPDEGCASCDWKYKEGWSEPQKQQFLMAHIRHAHKEEIE